MKRVFNRLVAVAAVTLASAAAHAQEVTVDVNRISAEGVGENVGTIRASAASGGGVTFVVDVQGLPAGTHGFHLHQNGDCGPGEQDGQVAAGMAAGGHYDPGNTGTHAGPEGAGHLGDLPRLELTGSSTTQTVTAPRLSLTDIRGRALMIHEGGDTYTDQPELGGGGARIACAVVPQ